jgi:predicted metal-binding membrane protein
MDSTTQVIPTGVTARVAAAGVGVVAVAWALLGVLMMTGLHEHVSHDALLGHGHHGLSLAQLLVFVSLWAVMAIAMMLPAALPTVAAHAEMAPGTGGRTLASTIAATVALWTGFAVVALAGDAVLHELVESGTLPESVQALLPGLILVTAGVFQLTPIKHRALAAARGATRPWSHAMSCLGGCWALMLMMFALGSGSLIVMAVLTVVMVLEQLVPGRTVATLAGAALIAIGLTVTAR